MKMKLVSESSGLELVPGGNKLGGSIAEEYAHTWEQMVFIRN